MSVKLKSLEDLIEDKPELRGKKIGELSGEQQAEVITELEKLNQDILVRALENKATSEDVTEIRESLNKIDHDLRGYMVNALNHLSNEFKSYRQSSEQKTEKVSLRSYLTEGDGKHDYDDLLNGRAKSLRFSTKEIQTRDPGAMSISGNVSGGLVPQAERVPGLDMIPYRTLDYLNKVNVGTLDSRTIEWVYQANRDGQPAPVAEGNTKALIDFDLVVAQQSVQTVAAHVITTKQMLRDISYMQSTINDELSRRLGEVTEAQVYSGNNTPPQLNGHYTVAPAFAAGAFATAVTNPTRLDVLYAAVTQIKLANQPMPTHIFLNPVDYARLLMEKNEASATDREYNNRITMIGDRMILVPYGIEITIANIVETDKYFVAHMPYARMDVQSPLEIEIGFINDQFTRNQLTIRAEWDVVAYIKHNQRSAFLKGDFSDDITAITAE